jgi:HSP20 family protein
MPEGGVLMVLKKAAKGATGLLGKSLKGKSADLLLDRNDFLDPFAVGSWTPYVDTCQTEKHVVVRVELPGVNPSDIAITFAGENLRIQGIKREPPQSHKLLCYYCLERTYGKFDRNLHIGWVVNPRRARAYLKKGVLTIEFPKVEDRRGNAIKIRIATK